MSDETAGVFCVHAASALDLATLTVRAQACFKAGALASGRTAEIEWVKADYLDLKTSMLMADAYEASALSHGCEFFRSRKCRPASAGISDAAPVSPHSKIESTSPKTPKAMIA